MRRRDLLAAAALFPVGATSARAESAPALGWLTGIWRGEGTLMGAPGTAELDARLALAERFLEIGWRTQGDNANGRRFEGRGFYRLEGDPWPGSWFDSSGAIRPLTARLEKQALHVDWGSAETERGRSSYVLGDQGMLIVEDSVFTAAGPRVFATHRLRRTG